ncbi:DNA primase [plant metagenome]|uniref:DNA primase n=1 Tax=plant metagenome TaxID=1297885 RepID=A0A484U4N8_9ZZZZ
MAPLYQALSEAQRIYWGGLAKHPKAESFLQDERGLTQDSIQSFELGVVGRGVVKLLRRPDQVLIEAGLAIQDEHGRVYDRFRDRVMFPIRNERGHLISFAGRALTIADHIPKYLNGPETELFRKHHELYGLHLAKNSIRKTQKAVVVEGYFDVIQGHQAGDTRLVASMGTAVSPAQVQRLLRLADELVFVFDGDVPGRKASLSAAKVFLGEMEDGKSASFVFLPDEHDPDSYLRRYGITGWQDLLKTAQPLSQVLARYVSHGLDMAIPESQVKASGKAKECIRLITGAPMYARALCSHLEQVIQISLAEERA